VVNGTGVVIHTNLGRSPLPEKARQQLVDISFHYSNLEFNLATGERGSRYSHLEPLICELTGAEASLVVNNNAAALLLALSSMATGREVIVSRGELVEIGGSFRIPEIMAQSGAILREVGTTNRTHLQDYRGAITADTGMLLKVHCSNFAMVGFTAEVAAQELALLGKETGIPVVADVGSGNLVDLESLVGRRETTIREFIKSGVDLVTCSGDKLLGGPQIGIIAGRKSLLEPMKKHPLLRALRVDKMTLAALEVVLQLYRDERRALTEIPVLRMLTIAAAELNLRARKTVRWLQRRLPADVSLSLVKGNSQAGGGALPQLELPTTLIAVTVRKLSANEIEERLRCSASPVVGRIAKGAFLLDIRTILDDDLGLLLKGLSGLSP
jgi:L-seryl-tRNA(Ser) seleniumtransferase